MKKKAVQIVSAATLTVPLLIGGGGVKAEAAANTTPGCVTIAEFKRVALNHTKRKVEAGIIGARGTLAVRWRTPSGAKAATFTYPACSRYYRKGSLAAVSYRWQSPTNTWVVIDASAVFAKRSGGVYTRYI